MRQSVVLGLVSLLSFVGGLAVNSSSHAQKSERTGEVSEPINRPTSTPSPSPEEDKYPKLVEDNYVTKFNGRRLDLDYGGPFISDDLPGSVDAAKLTALRDGGLIVSIGDTLVRFNAQLQAVWRNHLGEPIFDYAYVDSTNLIYGTAMDNNMFVLDAREWEGTHRQLKKWQRGIRGRCEIRFRYVPGYR